MSQTKAQLIDGKVATVEFSGGSASAPSIAFTGDTNTGIYSPGADQVAISTNGAGRLFVDASGNVGVNTSPSSLGSSVTTLEIKGGSTARSGGLRVSSSDSSVKGAFYIYDGAGVLGTESATPLDLYTGNSPRLRIDSSGRLLVGTSTSRDKWFNAAAWGNPTFQLETAVSVTSVASIVNNANDDGPGALFLAKSRAGSVGGVTVVNNNDIVGRIAFQGADGTEMVAAAMIEAQVDGTPGANDMPGRLVFSVTADGASSPTEAVRISQNRVTQFQNDIIPGADNAYQVGQSGRRWSVVFAGTGTINTSDANLKQDIEALEQAELNVAAAIKGLVKKFRFIDAVEAKGGAARIHIGVIAQEVEQAFIDEGLDPRRYAMFCEDTVEDGSKRLGIRYDELLAFVIAAL